MNSIVKWLFIIGSTLVVLIIAATLIIPKFVDIKEYKPVIEQKVAQATGRSFSMGEDMDFSIFPWVVVRLTDLHLGNPPGFTGNDMLSVKSFEIRLKLIPLLSRNIEVKTFAMNEPVINLQKLKNGKTNWESIGTGKNDKKSQSTVSEKNADSEKAPLLPIQALLVDTFSITNGKLIYIDSASGTRKEISDINLDIDNISFDKAIKLSLNTKLDKQPVSLKGNIGPIGKNPGQENIGLDLNLEAMGQLAVKIKGILIAPLKTPGFDLNISVSPFSPKKLADSLNQTIPITPGDSKVLEKLGLNFTVKGNLQNLSLTAGKLVLDDSTMDFSCQVNNFNLPDLKFNLKLDSIDLDRYLPASEPAKQPENKETTAPSTTDVAETKTTQTKKTDYTALRKLILDGNINIGKIKAKGVILENIDGNILARNGIINIDPLKLDLYKGILSTKTRIDLSNNEPALRLYLDMKGIQVNPLLKDLLEKDIIEGQLDAQLGLSMTGENPVMIKNTLTGEGEIMFTDGAIIGIDLADTVRTIKSVLGLSEPLKEKPKTDFAEVKIPFLANNGLIKIDGTSLVSPLMRAQAQGTIYLPKEELDLKVSPKLVATIKGQGDAEERSGLTVPVSITGTFKSPVVRPDLKSIINETLTTDPKKLKDNLLNTKDKLLDTIKGKSTSNDDGTTEPDVGKQIKNIFRVLGQ